jgi:hypothetical protein
MEPKDSKAIAKFVEKELHKFQLDDVLRVLGIVSVIDPDVYAAVCALLKKGAEDRLTLLKKMDTAVI